MGRLRWYERDPHVALADMKNLTLEERGAYQTVLDLIYAHDGQIEDDDRFLAGWCRVDVRIWRRVRTRLIDLEKIYVRDGILRTVEADRVVAKGLRMLTAKADAGRTSAHKSRVTPSKTNDIASTAVATDAPTDPPHTYTYQERDGGDARARALLSEAAIELANQVMLILGIDLTFVPPGWCGAPMWFQAGLTSGWSPDVIRIAARKVAAKKRDGPPNSFKYLEQPIVREHKLAAAPISNIATGGEGVQKTRSVQDVVRDLGAQSRRPAAAEPTGPERQLPLLRSINRN